MNSDITPRRFPGAIVFSVLLALSITILFINQMASAQWQADATLTPLLTIDKQVDRSGAAAGSTLVYTVVVNNLGTTAANNVTFTDTLPADLQYVNNSLTIIPSQAFTTSANVTNNMITWSGSIGAGGAITTLFEATIDNAAVIGSSITNTATITGTGSLLFDDAVITVIPPLVITKQVDQAEAEPGSELVYTVVVSNTGSIAATATFTDALPAELTYVANSLNISTNQAFTTTVTLADGVINWDASLGPGGSITTMFNATVGASVPLGSSVTNIAAVSHSDIPLTAVATTLITHVVPITKYIYMPSIYRGLTAPTLQATTPTADYAWTVSWNQVEGAVTGYRLEEAFDANFTNNLTVYNLGSNVTSRNIQHNPPASGIYYYRVRAEAAGNSGPWSNVVPVYVASPVNLTNSLPSFDNGWTMSWNSAPGASAYELQESLRSDFSSDVQSFNTGTATSKGIVHGFNTTNIRYYRVRALYTSAPGPWSNTVRVVSSYQDVFNSNATGWAMRRTDNTNYNVFYRDNADFQVELANANDYVLVSPLAPTVELGYQIEFRAKLTNPADRHMYGLVFGGDWNGNTCPNNDYSSCFTHYYLFRVQYRSNNGAPFLEFKVNRISGHDSNNQPEGVILIDWVKATAAAPGDWNKWRIEVEADGDIKVSLGDTRLASVRDDTLTQFIGDYFGLWGETKENGAFKVNFDDIQIRRQKPQ